MINSEHKIKKIGTKRGLLIISGLMKLCQAKGQNWRATKYYRETLNRKHKFCNANAIKTHIQGIRDILTKDSPKQREACKIEQRVRLSRVGNPPQRNQKVNFLES